METRPDADFDACQSACAATERMRLDEWTSERNQSEVNLCDFTRDHHRIAPSQCNSSALSDSFCTSPQLVAADQSKEIVGGKLHAGRRCSSASSTESQLDRNVYPGLAHSL